MPEVNEESITTVPLLPEAENLSADDLLYLIQGLGADRDKKLTLGALAEFLSTLILLSKSVKTDMLDDNAVTSDKLADSISLENLSTNGLKYDIEGSISNQNSFVKATGDVDLTSLQTVSNGRSVRIMNFSDATITVTYYGNSGTTTIEPTQFKEFVKISTTAGTNKQSWAVSA